MTRKLARTQLQETDDRRALDATVVAAMKCCLGQQQQDQKGRHGAIKAKFEIVCGAHDPRCLKRI